MFVKNKVSLITGGVSGLGLCFAKELLRNGIRGVTLADVDDEKGREVIPLLENEFGPGKAIFVNTDVSNKEKFEEAFRKTIEVFGNIDIVINSAGIVAERNIKKVTDINLNGVIIGSLLAMDEYLPKYRTSSESVIVNISSIFGLEGCCYGVVYTAAKHGVTSIGKCLSTKPHYEATGVKLLTICPGYTTTPILDNVEEKIMPGRYYEMMQTQLSNYTLQKPEVVAKGLLKILEKFETGEVWIIEGGECYQVEIPTRFSLKRIKTLEIEAD